MKKKRKAKRLRRREYRTVGRVTIDFEASALARSAVEAERIVEQVLNLMHLPKAVRVKLGKRSRLLKDCVDYFIETGSAELDDLRTERADESNKTIT